VAGTDFEKSEGVEVASGVITPDELVRPHPPNQTAAESSRVNVVTIRPARHITTSSTFRAVLARPTPIGPESPPIRTCDPVSAHWFRRSAWNDRHTFRTAPQHFSVLQKEGSGSPVVGPRSRRPERRSVSPESSPAPSPNPARRLPLAPEPGGILRADRAGLLSNAGRVRPVGSEGRGAVGPWSCCGGEWSQSGRSSPAARGFGTSAIVVAAWSQAARPTWPPLTGSGADPQEPASPAT
jgi:hypothetical protein